MRTALHERTRRDRQVGLGSGSHPGLLHLLVCGAYALVRGAHPSSWAVSVLADRAPPMVWKADARRVPTACAGRYRAGVTVARPLLFLDVDGTLLPFGGPGMLPQPRDGKPEDPDAPRARSSTSSIRLSVRSCWVWAATWCGRRPGWVTRTT